MSIELKYVGEAGLLPYWLSHVLLNNVYVVWTLDDMLMYSLHSDSCIFSASYTMGRYLVWDRYNLMEKHSLPKTTASAGLEYVQRNVGCFQNSS